ncbi:taste receptor type 2 member 42-like [Dasypus novemcinctus]|uniref:taste receptor type 2 member 42-like n=1 Tax=Dasypus novemcinctus TaxID=9361 RepID=UPI0039C918C0
MFSALDTFFLILAIGDFIIGEVLGIALESDYTVTYLVCYLPSLTNFIPTVLSLTSLLHVFLFLVKHTKSLHPNFLGSRDPSTEAHP